MPQQEDEKQLADIFLLLIPIQSLVSFKLATDVGKFFIDALDLSLLTLACKFNSLAK